MALSRVSLATAKTGIHIRMTVSDESLFEGIPKQEKNPKKEAVRAKREPRLPAFENVQSLSLKAFFAGMTALGYKISEGVHYEEVKRKRAGKPGARETFYTGYALSVFLKKDNVTEEKPDIAALAARFFNDPWNCVGMYPNSETISIVATGRDMKVVPTRELTVEKNAIVLEPKQKLVLYPETVAA